MLFKGRSGGSPFTLIELLVVVAVISILAALLLPSLTRARELGKRVLCLNNHKQMGLGVSFYTAANREFIPFTHKRLYGATFPYVYWFEFLFAELANDGNPYGYWGANYGKQHKIWNFFLCPSSPSKGDPDTSAAWRVQTPIWGSVFFGANMSYNFERLNRGSVTETDPITGASYTRPISNRLDAIKNPSRKLLICDHGDTSDGNNINQWWLVAQAAIYLGQYLPGGGLSAGGQARYGTYGWGTPTGARLRDWWKGRHVGTSNLLYVDGHCASLQGSVLGSAAYVGVANYSYLNPGGLFSAWDY